MGMYVHTDQFYFFGRLHLLTCDGLIGWWLVWECGVVGGRGYAVRSVVSLKQQKARAPTLKSPRYSNRAEKTGDWACWGWYLIALFH